MDVIQNWIVIVVTVIGSFFLFRYLRRRKKQVALQNRIMRIEKEGVEFTSAKPGLGFDPKMMRKDGRVPCCLTIDWTHPETNELLTIKSQWFWYNPRKDGDNIEFKDIKGKVVPSDPTFCSVDLSEYKVAIFI